MIVAIVMLIAIVGWIALGIVGGGEPKAPEDE
jgi:hypothetical protein